MRILIIDTYYPAFLQDFFAKHPGLAAQPYASQWQALMDECFGTADFYSTNLNALGHEATEVVPNCEPMQRQWAQENGLPLPKSRPRLALTRRRGIPWLRRVADHGWHYAVLRAQVRQFRPDVLYVQDMHSTSAAFLREVRADVGLVVGQIASPYALDADLQPYDLILTSLPQFVDRFRAQGLQSDYFRIGFEPRVLQRMKLLAQQYPLSFVGGLSGAHTARVQFLEQVGRARRVDFWGYGFDALPRASSLRRSFHGAAWGLPMYEILQASGITLNQHGGVAEDAANNMRLYEATGVGTLLLTDDKKNLAELFEPGREVAVYSSTEECLEMIDYYLARPEERDKIAQAGQARTLREHTYFHRMQELTAILEHRL